MSAMKLLKIAAVGVDLFFRAGRAWSKEGTTIPVTDLTEADLARIKAEPRLHVELVDGDAEDRISDAELRELVSIAIAALEAEGFDKDGKPKLAVLRAAIPAEKARITVELRDEIWAALQATPSPPAGQ